MNYIINNLEEIKNQNDDDYKEININIKNYVILSMIKN